MEAMRENKAQKKRKEGGLEEVGERGRKRERETEREREPPIALPRQDQALNNEPFSLTVTICWLQ